MNDLTNWAEAAVVSAEVAMATGRLEVAETRLSEARAFVQGAIDRRESHRGCLLVSQEIGLSEARLIVARINGRTAS